ncbi:MAG: hypothetical protein RLZZ524_469 [Pseudomonadota bacterium]|jgi:hypothetical protein
MPEEWAALTASGALTEDLLPCVANTAAAIAQDSKLKDLGKTPSRYNRERKAVGIPSWTRAVTTQRQIEAWRGESDYSICLQTRQVRAFDIDIADPARAQAAQDLIEALTGALPCRWRENSGKRLLAFWCPGELSKRVLRTEHGAVELLATGQQFIACGTHPSGVRYQWSSGLVPAVFPELTRAEMDTVWALLVATLATPGSAATANSGRLPTQPRTRLDVADTMVAWLEENDWLREYDRDGRVHIRCPWEHEHTSSDVVSSTTYFPRGVGGFQQGHFRCLHAHCTGRGDHDFLSAMGYEAAQFPVVPASAAAPAPVLATGVSAVPDPNAPPWPAFSRDRSGGINSTALNARMALERPDLVGVHLGTDLFRGKRMIAPFGGSAWREFKDSDYFALRVTLEQRGFVKIGPELVKDAVRAVSEANAFDSAKEWITRLVWDGKPRVASFFASYFGCAEDDAYARAVGVYLWTALAARCYDPGHKVDIVPVLVSAQGVGKTSVIEALAPLPDAFIEVNLEHKDDQLAKQLRGKLVGEIAELRGLAGRDAESIKAWISRRWEETRALWSEFHSIYPRRCVFIGTANRDDFLADSTGERRWAPLWVNPADVEGIVRDRDQLWAEGFLLFQAQGVAWQEAERLARDVHADFKQRDAWQDVVAHWLSRDVMDAECAEHCARGSKPFKMLDVAVSALGMNVRDFARKDELRLAACLRALGYIKRKVRLQDGSRNEYWVREEVEVLAATHVKGGHLQ